MQHFQIFLSYLFTGFLITSKSAKATLKGNKNKHGLKVYKVSKVNKSQQEKGNKRQQDFFKLHF